MYRSDSLSLHRQLIEAWVGLTQGGRASQQAYYVYDELAQNPSQAGQASTTNVLVGKAVAQMVQGQWAEAESTLSQAEQLDPQNEDVLANKVTSATHLSRNTEQLQQALR